MQNERRKSKRFTVVELDIFLQEPEEHIGKVVNLSEGGMLVISGNELEPKKVVKCRIPFTRTINEQVNFDFEARIVWSSPNTLEPSQFRSGMEFAENPQIQAYFINQMVKVFGPQPNIH
jgi:hypothetical protein